MKAIWLTIVLTGSTVACAVELTGRELALLRIVLRRDMAMDRRAARDSGNALMADRASPLGLVRNDPNVDELHTIMTDEATDVYKRFNAARALAYLGDTRSVDMLAETLAGEFAMTSSCFEQTHAATCLLYLEYDFAEDFLFTRLPNALHPELNVFLEDPNRPGWPWMLYSERYNYSLDPNLPHTNEQVAAIVTSHLGFVHPVRARGPLSILEVECRELQFNLDLIDRCDLSGHVLRFPFSGCPEEWRDFKAQIRAGDLIYYFTTDEIDWQALGGREGYVLIREGEVAATLITGWS